MVNSAGSQAGGAPRWSPPPPASPARAAARLALGAVMPCGVRYPPPCQELPPLSPQEQAQLAHQHNHMGMQQRQVCACDHLQSYLTHFATAHTAATRNTCRIMPSRFCLRYSHRTTSARTWFVRITVSGGASGRNLKRIYRIVVPRPEHA